MEALCLMETMFDRIMVECMRLIDFDDYDDIDDEFLMDGEEDELDSKKQDEDNDSDDDILLGAIIG